jgi:hypothetical protein
MSTSNHTKQYGFLFSVTARTEKRNPYWGDFARGIFRILEALPRRGGFEDPLSMALLEGIAGGF